jgi:hypothetical protein
MRIKLTSIVLLYLLSISVYGQFACQDYKQRVTAGFGGPSINNNAKSDTFDILHYHLELDFTTLPQRLIQGRADISATPLLSHNGVLNLDLLILQADSILQDGQAVTYNHNDTILRVNLLPNTSLTDTFTLSVFYSGTPPGDGSGWGGWHHANPYFFNLGVGFAADPHTYGRAWHPCYDNFVEKATYDFEVLTVKPRRPYCNGIRVSESVVNGDTILTTWDMTEAIPTYLASIAISNYAEISDTVQGLAEVLPIQLMARPGDSAAAVNAFGNLKGMLHSFEKAFGPYHWQRIGYAMTTVGAMEHATSIHLPRNLLNPGGEDIIAHELAHHWWGNLVTCETDLDMWINEGMAEYCSHLYTEDVYDRDRYVQIVRNNAYRVLTQAHKSDDGYRPIYGLDHEYVYGFHVYQKGAMVAHNLRGYLGDSLFFYGLSTLLNNHKYGNLNTTQFRDELSNITGTNLNDFFQNWVYNPGFPSLWTTGVQIQGGQVSGFVIQGVHEAPGFFNGMPVDLTFFDSNGQQDTRRIIHNGATTPFNFNNLPFTPVFVTANYASLVLSADPFDEYEPGDPFFDKYSDITLSPYSAVNSAKVISVQHWSGPDQGAVPPQANYRVSQNRFWSVYFTDTTDRIEARIVVNGTANGMDQDLLGTTGDSLAIMYRPLSGGEFKLWPYQSRTIFGAPGSLQGFIELDSVKAGDYILANTAESIGLIETSNEFPYDIYPNPADSFVLIQAPRDWWSEETVIIYDRGGRIIYRGKHQFGAEPLKLELDELNSGFVIIQIGKLSRKLVLE